MIGYDIAAAIANRLNWPLLDAIIRQRPLNGLRNCEIYDAYDRRILDGASVGVARLSGGDLIVGTEPGALEAVFSGCVSAWTPAGALAELLVRFSDYAAMRVLHDASVPFAQTRLDEAGRTFAPPEAIRDQHGLVVRFLALSMRGVRLYCVEGRVTNGEVSVSAERLKR
jgi:hypothetical protein